MALIAIIVVPLRPWTASRYIMSQSRSVASGSTPWSRPRNSRSMTQATSWGIGPARPVTPSSVSISRKTEMTRERPGSIGCGIQ